jgi:hypothetical protein
MAYEARFSVLCKHGDCRTTIVFGHYLITPKTAGDRTTPPSIEPGRLLCPRCGRDADYTHEDAVVAHSQTVSNLNHHHATQ